MIFVSFYLIAHHESSKCCHSTLKIAPEFDRFSTPPPLWPPFRSPSCFFWTTTMACYLVILLPSLLLYTIQCLVLQTADWVRLLDMHCILLLKAVVASQSFPKVLTTDGSIQAHHPRPVCLTWSTASLSLLSSSALFLDYTPGVLWLQGSCLYCILCHNALPRYFHNWRP